MRHDFREYAANKMSMSESGCWTWTGSLDKDGYGKSWQEGGSYRAHRASYEFFVGPIPAGLTIDHLCRNRACVRPDHLEPVTNGVNIMRGIGVAPVNVRKTECPSGHAYSGANLRIEGTERLCRTCQNARRRRRYKVRWANDPVFKAKLLASTARWKSRLLPGTN